MLSGLYKIDGVDLWNSFGAVVLANSYNSILQYPERVEPDSNNWYEQDGLDVDLSTAVFEAYEVSLNIGIYAKTRSELLSSRYNLFNLLSGVGYRTIAIKSLGLELSLRYIESSNAVASPMQVGSQFYLEQAVKFSCDNPLQLFKLKTTASTFDFTFDKTFKSFSSNTLPIPFFGINRNVLSSDRNYVDYGIAVKSFNGSALQFDSMKEPLIQKTQNKSGNTVYVSGVRSVKHRTLNISLAMASDNIQTLLNNYKLFFRDIASSGLKTITSSVLGLTFEGYYSKQNNLDIYGLSKIGGYYIFEFDIDFVVTNKIQY